MPVEIVKAPARTRGKNGDGVGQEVATAMLKMKVGQAIKVPLNRQHAGVYVTFAHKFTSRTFRVQSNGDGKPYIIRDK